ncbi:D-alanyl-D-alanine carboxypeptidase family protein [Microbacterium sp.]|uniref:D-alanyl-D-alanine carboxypeptidase family protein n=1 Tax=Microbacterium sp. TaxID=51671 RepID=UPI003A8C959B
MSRETWDELADLQKLMQDSPDAATRDDDPDAGRRRRRVRLVLLIVFVVIVAMIAGAGGYVVWALHAPVPAPHLVSAAPAVPNPATAALTLPSDGSSTIRISGADAYFAGATKLTLTSGGNAPKPMASISKLITALVVLEKHPLKDASDAGPTITFGKAAHDLYDKYYVMDATIAPMPIGATMSLRGALAAMLIPSASNYAEAVSTWAYGSQYAFVGAARRWLKAHGMNDTTFVEPTGISAQNESTPRDLLKLGKLAAADPTIAELVATRGVSLPATGMLSNTNHLLGSEGIDGLKTGNLGQGRFNLLYTSSLDVGLDEPLLVSGAILGATTEESVETAVLSELNSIRAGFYTLTVAEAGQKVGTYTTAWGSSARLVVRADASIFTWSDTPITVRMKTTTPKAYEDGTRVGTLTWTAGPSTTTAYLGVEGTIEPPSAWWRLTHPGELG